MFKKIANRIIISITVLIIIAICFLAVFIDNLAKDNHQQVIRREMVEKVRILKLFLSSNSALGNRIIQSGDKTSIREISEIINLRISIIDGSGKVLADSAVNDPENLDNHIYRKEIIAARERGSGESERYSDTLKTPIKYYAEKHGDVFLRLAKPMNEIEASLKLLHRAILIMAVFLILISILMTILITRRITKPIVETIGFAETFSRGDYSHRILNYNDDDIGTLQKTLNRMADTIIDKMNNLILEQNKLQVTIENIQDGISVIDSSKRIIIANKAFSALLGIQSKTIQRVYYEVIRGSSFNSKIDYSLTRGETVTFQEETLNGRVCDVFITPIREEAAIQGILIVLHDITEKKRLDRLKTDLVGNLSHELKTPITILKGYLETVIGHLNEPEVCRPFIDKALINVDRQNSIINDMIKLNMLETLPSLPEEEIDLRQIITGCTDILQPKAAAKGITLRLEIGEQPLVTRGNRFLGEEVFFNIIDNAINYNVPDGTVTVTLMPAGKGGGRIISVEDTGIGIPSESVPRIFERFYRVDKSRSRATGGTGLGLSIVKHAADILGWEIRVESRNTGTRFFIEI